MQTPGNRLPVSAVIITLNESNSLPDCLNSLDFVDEIVVVDSGSTDDSIAIAEKMGARVFSKEWLGYGQQKNYAIKQARHDWVLCIDADERIDKTLQQSIIKTLTTNQPPFDGYRMARRNHFLGRGLKHGFGYPDYKLRLLNRHKGRWTEPKVHEYIQLDNPAPIGTLHGDLLHFSGENLQQYLEKHNTYTTLQALQALQAPPQNWLRLKMVINPILCFLKGYFLKRAFLDGLPGFVHTLCHCFTTFSKYAKIYEAKLQDELKQPRTDAK